MQQCFIIRKTGQSSKKILDEFKNFLQIKQVIDIPDELTSQNQEIISELPFFYENSDIE